jgi:hypothetical protein
MVGVVRYSDGVKGDDLMSASALEKGKGDLRLMRGMSGDDDPRRERHEKKPNGCSFHLVGVYHQPRGTDKGTYGSLRTVTFSGGTPSRS